nr:hypothetical protein [Tanacetum cinerariifolium]
NLVRGYEIVQQKDAEIVSLKVAVEKAKGEATKVIELRRGEAHRIAQLNAELDVRIAELNHDMDTELYPHTMLRWDWVSSVANVDGMVPSSEPHDDLFDATVLDMHMDS